MKERPILFSGPMVRAILEGRKTQTRRVLKQFNPAHGHLNVTVRDGVASFYHLSDPVPVDVRCRYGQPGDRLWVRETWAPLLLQSECTGPEHCRFSATSTEAEFAITRWKPSIHMPRWASRITLEVTGVRVERLQDITEADAKGEGATPKNGGLNEDGSPLRTHRTGFVHIWGAINGLESWFANPWVWVVEFRRMAP